MRHLKLIKDDMNGGRYQWRYHDPETDLWFDYHDAFDDRGAALNHDLGEICMFRVSFVGRSIGALGHGENQRRVIQGSNATQAILDGVYNDLEHINTIKFN